MNEEEKKVEEKAPEAEAATEATEAPAAAPQDDQPTEETKTEALAEAAKPEVAPTEEAKTEAAAPEEAPAEEVVPEAEEEVEELPYTDLRSGMTARVHERIKDTNSKGEEKERIQIFEGLILGIKGPGNKRTMTIRKVSKGGFGVEKIFPLSSPNIAKIEVVKKARTRRAKLWFLRRGHKKRLKETKVNDK